MPHSQGLKTRNRHALRAQCVQATGNISWALFLLGMMQSLLLFSDLCTSSGISLTSLSLLQALRPLALPWVWFAWSEGFGHTVFPLLRTQFSLFFFFFLTPSAIHVVLPILTFPDKSMPPHYWKALANSILLKGGIINEGVGRGPSGFLLPKAGWNRPLDSGIDRAVWKGSLQTMIKCDRYFFHGSLPFIQKSVLLHSWIFEAPAEKKRNRKKKERKAPLLRCMIGARWILEGEINQAIPVHIRQIVSLWVKKQLGSLKAWGACMHFMMVLAYDLISFLFLY